MKHPMKHSYILLPTGDGIELSPVAEGIIETLTEKGLDVARFIPFGNNSVRFKEIRKYLAEGNEQELMEFVVEKEQELSTDNDVVIIEGISDQSIFYKKELHKLIAAALDTNVILITSAYDKPAQSAIDEIAIEARSHRKAREFVAGCIIVDVPSKEYEQELREAGQKHNMPILALVYGKTDKKSVMAGIQNEPWDHILKEEREHRTSPSEFRNSLIKKAQKSKARIVLPEGSEPRTVRAAVLAFRRGIAIPMLLAKREEVEKVAKEQAIELPKDLPIIDPETVAEEYVSPLIELRKNKGMTEAKARELLKCTVWVGTMMVKAGKADGLVSGAVHTTADTVRPAMQIIKTYSGTSIVSSIFFMCLPDQVLVYGDCSINPNPTADELAQIAIQSADSAKNFGIVPKVAMLSYSTGESGKGEMVDKVSAATKKVRELRPDIEIDGPLQYDAAIAKSVARIKAPESKIAGHATVFVFPDLNSGNITYKAVQRSTNIVSIGPMLQGLAKPVNDLSRGALVEDIVYTIAITAVQAGMRKN